MRHKNQIRSAALTLAMSIAPLAAQSGARAALDTRNTEETRPEQSFGAPRIGRSFDPSRSTVAALTGLPGAASFGAARALPAEFAAFEMFPAGDLAIGVLPDSGRAVLLSWQEDIPSLVSGDALAEGVARIALSPSGGAVALYLPAEGSIQVFSRTGSSLHRAAAVDLLTLAGEIVSLAVNDAGSRVYAATWDGLRGALYSADGGGRAELVAEIGKASAIAFLPASASAILADISRNTLSLIEDAAPLPNITPLAGEAEGIVRPIAVRAVEAGRAVVALQDDSRIGVIDLATHSATFVECPCRPSSLTPVGSDAVLQLGRSDSGSTWFLDLTSASARVFFVPPGEDQQAVSEVPNADRQ